MEILDIVNDKDEVIGQAERKEAHEKKLPHRIAHVFIFNDQGEMAMQLRSDDVEFEPGAWITAGSGHVEAGKTYEQAARQELQEETGIDKLDLEFIDKDAFEYPDGSKLFLGVFRGEHNGPFIPHPREVVKIEFFSLDKIRQMVQAGEKFHSEFKFLLKKHFNIF